jgi:hypothetical protein
MMVWRIAILHFSRPIMPVLRGKDCGPHIPAGYLSADPDNRSKSVTWELEANTALVPEWASQFWRLARLDRSNPWLRVLGSQRTLDSARSIPGAIIGDAWSSSRIR